MNNKTNKSNESGFSLIELVIVSVILVFMIGIIGGIVNGVQRSYTQQRPRIEALNDATAALDFMFFPKCVNNPILH